MRKVGVEVINMRQCNVVNFLGRLTLSWILSRKPSEAQSSIIELLQPGCSDFSQYRVSPFVYISDINLSRVHYAPNMVQKKIRDQYID